MGNTCLVDNIHNCCKQQPKPINKSPDSSFSATLLNESDQDIVITRKTYDELRVKYGKKCQQYEEIEDKYSKLQNQYNILFTELIDPTELHAMYQHEYDTLLHDFIKYQQKHQNTESDYTNIIQQHSTLKNEHNLLSKQMNATQIKHDHILAKYDNILKENALNLKQMKDKYSALKTQYDEALNQLDETNGEYQQLMDKLVTHKRTLTESNAEYVQYRTMNIIDDEKYSKLKKEYGALLSEMNEVKDEYESLMQDITEYKLMDTQYKEMDVKYRAIKAECDENKRCLNETSEKYCKLEHEYGVLYNELTQTKRDNKQLENAEELTKQITFLKQNQNQLQMIYEAEYEKLLNEFNEYKDSYPPN